MIKLLLFLQKEKWRLVKTVVWETPIRGKEDIVGKFYIYCIESNKGKRSINVATTFIDIKDIKDIMFIIRQYEYYHEVIYPWVLGIYEPTIPSYYQSIEIDNSKKEGKIFPLK